MATIPFQRSSRFIFLSGQLLTFNYHESIKIKISDFTNYEVRRHGIEAASVRLAKYTPLMEIHLSQVDCDVSCYCRHAETQV